MRRPFSMALFHGCYEYMKVIGFGLSKGEDIMDKAFLVVSVIKTNAIQVMKTSDFADNYAEYEPLAEADSEAEAEELAKGFK